MSLLQPREMRVENKEWFIRSRGKNVSTCAMSCSDQKRATCAHCSEIHTRFFVVHRGATFNILNVVHWEIVRQPIFRLRSKDLSYIAVDIFYLV